MGNSQGKTTIAKGRPAAVRPSVTQKTYLRRGLTQPGGKLPLFDRRGQKFGEATIRACISNGWAEPWFVNPLKADWLVCRLTPEGYIAVGVEPPADL